MNIDKLQMDYYNLKDPKTTPFKITKNEIYKLNIPKIIEQLILIVEFLLKEGYTLSYICPHDFVLKDNILFLNETRHVVKIDEPIKITKKDECFHSKGLKATLERAYASIHILFIHAKGEDLFKGGRLWKTGWYQSLLFHKKYSRF